MKQARRTGGFTLFELLTSLAVFSVVSTIGMQALFRVTEHWETVNLRMDLNERGQMVVAQMRNDFDHVLSPKLSGVSIKGISRLEEEKRYDYAKPEDDRVILPISGVDPATGLREQYSAMYLIRRDNGPPSLVRRLGELGAEEPEGVAQLVAENVLAMRIEYAAGGQWHPDWDRPELPEAIRVSLVLMDDNRDFEQVARQAAFTIHVD